MAAAAAAMRDTPANAWPRFLRAFAGRSWPQEAAPVLIEIAGPTDRIGFDAASALPFRPVEIGKALGPLWATYWFRVTIAVPADWAGSRVDLYWDSASEALLWLDGRSSRGLNIGRHTAPILERAAGGERLTFHLEVACNRAFGADEGGVRGGDRTDPYRLIACRIQRFDPPAWALFHDFEVLRQLEADRTPPQRPNSTGGVAPVIVRPALDTTWAGRLLHDLNRVCNRLDPRDPATWAEAEAILRDLLAVGNGDVCHQLSAIGHAHIDTAWLWPIEETWRKCQRTFSTAIALMDAYPEFKFACSQACQYLAIEARDPDLFARILEKAKQGQWIPVGGSWVEPDCNLPSGESICRQFLYGQRYFERTFGARSTIFWNPDVFGYAGQLPQLMREAGMDRFLTQKLSWNKFTAPPHHSFHWRGIDGSEVLTHFPPADTYNGSATLSELRYHAANYKDADRSAEAIYLFGFGDGGGGPNAEMIEEAPWACTRDLAGARHAQRDAHPWSAALLRPVGDLGRRSGGDRGRTLLRIPPWHLHQPGRGQAPQPPVRGRPADPGLACCDERPGRPAGAQSGDGRGAVAAPAYQSVPRHPAGQQHSRGLRAHRPRTGRSGARGRRTGRDAPGGPHRWD